MVFDQIEQLKQEFTDKYVIVDEDRPELRRFKGMTGTVRTVNMNGRALVEFDANLNIGWYDIDLDFLKVVDKPLEKPEKPKAAAKPAAKKPAKAAAKAKGPASAADILAAARGGGAPKKEKPAAMSPAGILAAARGGGETCGIQEERSQAREGRPEQNECGRHPGSSSRWWSGTCG